MPEAARTTGVCVAVTLAAYLRDQRPHVALAAEAAPLQARALQALAAALRRHGHNGLQVHPAPPGEQTLRASRRALLGVAMRDAVLEGSAGEAPPAVLPSSEAQCCGAGFAA